MSEVNNSLSWARSDAVSKVISAESCHIVLETSPPDYVEKISRYLESSVGQSRRDEVSNGPAESESDSGDSLFLTQKPVPEAVRSGRRSHYSLRSKPISPRDLEGSGEDNSSSNSDDEESKSGKGKGRKTYTLPKSSFHFLAEGKCELLPVRNKRLHSYLIGGFFECVRLRELRHGCQTGEDLESSLPTVDMDGESISPLSEEDEERADDEDIKVVERKRFVVPSKARRKKNKSAAEDVRLEIVEGSLEPDVRAADSLSVSCNVEDGGKEEEKKKISGEDVEQLQFGAVAEPPNAEIQKKKKKKRNKQEGIVTTKQCEEEEASSRTLDLPPMLTEQLEELGNCAENAAASQETLKSSNVQRKKHKKKQPSFSHNATQDGEEDLTVCIDDSVTSDTGSGMSLKKKKNTVFEGGDISYSHEGKNKVGHTKNTKEGLEEENAKLTKKKKKNKRKMSEVLSGDVLEDKVVQSDDSVSVREKEKKRTSSFLVADAEESDFQTPGEQNSPSQSHVLGAEKHAIGAGDLEELNDNWVTKKKKKKRTMSVAQEKKPEQDLEEPNTGVKRKKKRTGNESESVTPVERLETADMELSTADAAVVLKKKKKKCKDEHVIQKDPPSATEDVESVKSMLNNCSSVSHKKKGKHCPSTETSISKCEMSPSDSIVKKKHRKVKRRLHNPSEGFFSDS